MLRNDKVEWIWNYVKDTHNDMDYESLNNEQIVITEKKDPRPYLNLALHYLNDDKDKEAIEHLQEALKIAPAFWHASQQMAALNIRSAKEFLTQALSTMPSTHPFKKQGAEVLEYLEKHTFGHVKVV